MSKKPQLRAQTATASSAPVAEETQSETTEQVTPPVEGEKEVVETSEGQAPEPDATEADESQDEQPSEKEEDVPVQEDEAEEQGGEAQELVPAVTLSIAQQVLREQLAGYVKNMAVNMPMTPEGAATHQLTLFNVLNGVMALEGQVFVAEMDHLLSVINAHRATVFNEYYVFRGLEFLRLTTAQRILFQRLVHLFINTCDPLTRGISLMAIDLGAALASPLEDAKQQRVMAYYTA